MAPNRARARNQQPQPPQPSDYETDAPPPALDVPLPPPRSNEELNLSVLRRVYPEVIAIEHVTSFVALYVFKLETQTWEKVGTEGTLFLCQLTPASNGAERYCVVILNRKGLDNFYLELTSSDDMEISEPYIIVQGDEVYGLWIFADPPPATTANSLAETAEKIMEIADRAKASRDAKDREGKNGVKQAVEQTEAASSAPMGRQLSLRQLFGQPREQDAGFSVNSYSSGPPPNMYAQQSAYMPPPNPAPAQQDVLVDNKEHLEGDELERSSIVRFLQGCTERRHETLETSWADMVEEELSAPEGTQSSKSNFANTLRELHRRRVEDANKQFTAKWATQTYDMKRRLGANEQVGTDAKLEGRGPEKTLYYKHLSGTNWKQMERKIRHTANDSLESELPQKQIHTHPSQTKNYWRRVSVHIDADQEDASVGKDDTLQSEFYWRYLVATLDNDSPTITTPTDDSPSPDQAVPTPVSSWWAKRSFIIKLDILIFTVAFSMQLYMLGVLQYPYPSLDES
ncbi:hypothetical protein HBI56_229600 [Parastagonospora nodorum]|uniref:PH domain-containing protein n=1 Tax=Phaeosphaeria nodorum (strain SN15 / ATCC MYA-4574 / FGSC 10173) TaxID=321614 RepID=A0A7U2F982_PHANO|nr:hypothetical protein HBH56_201520 [Parastagonospora nodorum]QRD00867.1 hypothetical protein JI435_093920 [Parastagonospora nodorum SN15]KAH3925784.1 hypothetical protein HBH54_174770 [Parastagonospora nodorum]KAH3976440.1 hypothetical protein HBH52_122520 [Parastagonospora nodorum]KAH4036838.1 hypothetical protein HBI09_078080 [Parastagonospora nodorum]